MWSTIYYGSFSWTGQCFLSFSIEEARIKNVRTMETLQNNNVWEYFATVEALMKSHQLSLILDVVNPLISSLSAELMFHIIFINLIPLFRLLG